jgi:hypothetical protein
MGKKDKDGDSSLGFWKSAWSLLAGALPVITQYLAVLVVLFGGFLVWKGISFAATDTAHMWYSLCVGFVFICVGLVLHYRSKPVTGFCRELLIELTRTESKLVETLQDAATRYLDTLAKEEQRLVAVLERQTADHLTQLLNEEKRLIARVEDATRRVLTGFPAIFERALWLIRRASEEKREIWFVNFALNFGRVHAENASIVAEYSDLAKRSLYTVSPSGNKSGDVVEFVLKLQQAVQDTAEVRILTITDDAADEFLTKLIESPGYESLNAHAAFKRVSDGIKNKKIQFRELAQRFRKNFASHSFQLYQTSTLPIQLFIARIPGREESSEERWGCLVFMLGTELVGKGIAQGYYTELDPIVSVYRNFARALMDTARIQHPELSYDWSSHSRS